MDDEIYDKVLHSWLILSGAIAILENEGMRLSRTLQKQGIQQSVEAFEAIVAALYLAKKEAHELFACTIKREKPEHLQQHSGNAPK